jgi:hypothetical protein
MLVIAVEIVDYAAVVVVNWDETAVERRLMMQVRPKVDARFESHYCPQPTRTPGCLEALSHLPWFCMYVNATMSDTDDYRRKKKKKEKERRGD